MCCDEQARRAALKAAGQVDETATVEMEPEGGWNSGNAHRGGRSMGWVHGMLSLLELQGGAARSCLSGSAWRTGCFRDGFLLLT